MIITDFEFALARRNNQTMAQANAVIEEAGRRINALERKLTATRKMLSDCEADNSALKLQIMRLSRQH